jgi:multidrug efflux pump subunit AcrB
VDLFGFQYHGLIRDTSLVDMLSQVGLIMLMGLVTKNAILLVDFSKVLRSRGMDRTEAIITAGRTRLRPIMMTTMAAVIFAGRGAIDYPKAAAMFLGCAVGSYFGAHYSDRIGNVWIKRLFILIVLIMVVKLLIP